MFVVVPQVLDPPKDDVLPPLLVADYPSEVRRMLALRLYYLTWGTSPFPFLDARVVPCVRQEDRAEFVRFTNLHYYPAIRGIMRSMRSPRQLVGALRACASCVNLLTCDELCLPGLDELGGDRSNVYLSNWLQRERENNSSDVVVATRPVDRQPAFQICLLWSDVQKRPAADGGDERLVPVPADQEEWWTE